MTTPTKSAPSTVRFRPEVKEALVMLSRHEGRSMANMLEWLIKQQCERETLHIRRSPQSSLDPWAGQSGECDLQIAGSGLR